MILMPPVRLLHRLCLIGALTAACPTAMAWAANDSPTDPSPGESTGTLQTGAADHAMPAGDNAPTPAGDNGSTPADDKRGNWTFLVENDLLAGTDRHYTNGLHLSWLSASDDVPSAALEAASWVPLLLAPDGKRRIGFNFGQSMFVPNDIKMREAQTNDRPWAGYLYGGVALLSETPTTLDILEVDIGVVGPASFAEQTQKIWHDLIGSPEPKGWNNQLKNEPTIVFIYERKWRQEIWNFAGPESGLGIDLTPLVGAAVGNVFTYASTGLALRFGDDLPSDFGPPRVRPSLPGSGFFDLDDQFGWYFFASAEGRAVAHNIFLDGNTFEDSASVDKLPFVADFQVGFAFMINSARITVTQVYRTREFRSQNEPDRFGAVSISFKF